jgi:hypothetical protein
MLSILPKISDKNLAIAFLLPALLALLAVAQVFPDALWSKALLAQLTAEQKSLPDIAVLRLAMWVLAFLLQTANHPIYRMRLREPSLSRTF